MTGNSPSDQYLEVPVNASAAIERISELVKEIEILCDEFNLDPREWLVQFDEAH